MPSGRPRRRTLIHLAGAAAVGAMLPDRPAAAAPLAADDLARLVQGEVVRVPVDLEVPAGDCFGGVSYAVIHAPPEAVVAVLADADTYKSIIPMTLESRVLWRRGQDTGVYFRQGGRGGSAAYALVVRRETRSLFRFWLDPREPHEIADLWGYFRVSAWTEGAADGARGQGASQDASLLTYAALVRLEPGLVKLLFSEAIRRYALGTPGQVRAFVEAHPAGSTPPPVIAAQSPPPSPAR